MFDEARLVRSFRRNAAQIREALAHLDDARRAAAAPPTAPVMPFVRDPAELKHYQAFAIPLRRALNAADRASFARTRAAFALAPGRPADRLGTLDAEWAGFQQELDSMVTLGGAPRARRAILHAWLEAVSFHDPLDKQNTYAALLEHWGTAAEGAAAPLAQRAAALVLQLDQTAAEVLDEPLFMPRADPAASLPPAPPAPRSWWRRLLGTSGAPTHRR